MTGSSYRALSHSNIAYEVSPEESRGDGSFYAYSEFNDSDVIGPWHIRKRLRVRLIEGVLVADDGAVPETELVLANQWDPSHLAFVQGLKNSHPEKSFFAVKTDQYSMFIVRCRNTNNYYCYREAECLGRGVFGGVYRAYQFDIKTGEVNHKRPYAVKVQRVESKPAIIRVQREAAYLKLFDHHAESVVIADTDDGEHAYGVMSELPGKPLSEFKDGGVKNHSALSQPEFDLAARLNACMQIASLLSNRHYAKRSNGLRRLVNRDFKSENLMLDFDASRKIPTINFCDYGMIAEVERDDDKLVPVEDDIGSNYVKAPEAKQQKIFIGSEVYSATESFLLLLGVGNPMAARSSIPRSNDGSLTKKYFNTGFSYDGLLHGVDIPTLPLLREGKAMDVKAVLEKFLRRMGAVDYRQRALTDEVLLFFTTFNQLVLLEKHKESKEQKDCDVVEVSGSIECRAVVEPGVASNYQNRMRAAYVKLTLLADAKLKPADHRAIAAIDELYEQDFYGFTLCNGRELKSKFESLSQDQQHRLKAIMLYHPQEARAVFGADRAIRINRVLGIDTNDFKAVARFRPLLLPFLLLNEQHDMVAAFAKMKSKTFDEFFIWLIQRAPDLEAEFGKKYIDDLKTAATTHLLQPLVKYAEEKQQLAEKKPDGYTCILGPSLWGTSTNSEKATAVDDYIKWRKSSDIGETMSLRLVMTPALRAGRLGSKVKSIESLSERAAMAASAA